MRPGDPHPDCRHTRFAAFTLPTSHVGSSTVRPFYESWVCLDCGWLTNPQPHKEHA